MALLRQFTRRRLPALLMAGCSVLCLAAASEALTLTTPREGQALQAGDSIPVAVRVDDIANIRSVRYFWFRLGDESVGSHQAEPAEFHARDSQQPVAGTLVVPVTAIGPMRLMAVADIIRGRLAGHQDFDEVVVTVQPQAALSAIEFAVEKPWRLHTLGKRLPVPALGQFEDGIARLLYGEGTGSTFHSSQESVVRVNGQGQLLVVGNGRAVVTVTNRQKVGRVEVVVAGEATPNRPPVAAAPASLVTKPGAVVLLSGLKSRDPDGDPLMFRWTQLRGNKVDLTTPNEATTSFVAPLVSERRLLQFHLVVTDLSGPDTVKGADSEPAVVDVWVEP